MVVQIRSRTLVGESALAWERVGYSSNVIHIQVNIHDIVRVQTSSI